MKVEALINKYKKQLIRKSKKTGIYENFGQTEVNILEDKYDEDKYSNNGVWNKIRDFDNWCMNYTGE